MLGSLDRFVLFVDTYEVLTALDNWLRDTFLPELSENVLVVLAGRNPPLAPWRIDPGWQSLIRAVPLTNLSPDDCRQYLRNRNVPDEEHEELLGFTHGHPLALSLVADVIEHQGKSFRPEQAPDVIKTLIDHFVLQVPTTSHRRALEACALLRFTTEAILGEVLDTPDVHEIFEWLRRLSFVESGPLGLSPHDLARDALSVDLRWRNPDWYNDLHNRARAYYSRRLSQTSGSEQERVLTDYAYLHRDNPIIRPFLDWAGTSGAVHGVATEAEYPALLSLIEEFEGAEATRLAEYWCRRQPENVLVFRNAEKQVVGTLFLIALERATSEDEIADPAVRAALRYLRSAAPLRAKERATYFRFWMATETYQQVSPTQSRIYLKIAQYYLTTADLAFTMLPVADPDFWAPFCGYIDLFRIPDADFEVGGRAYGVYGHDWRTVPPGTWLSILAERETATTVAESAPAPVSDGALVVLDETAFAAAVRDALRLYPRPDKMVDLPLLKTRLVVDRAGTETGIAERIDALRTLLDEASRTLEASPREAKFYRVLHRTFFSPARSQEQAAEMLDLPFSTYRRYLKTGVEQVTEWLWKREVGGIGEQKIALPAPD